MTTSLPSVTMDERVYLPSTWRDAIGKRLTNARIARLQREGFYGAVARQVALSKYHPKNGIVVRCACGNIADSITKTRSECFRCRALRRAEHEKNTRNHIRFQELMAKKYV